MIRNNALREQARRKFARDVCEYLYDPEYAKKVFSFSGLSDNENKRMERVHRAAEHLIKQTRQGKKVNLQRFQPFTTMIEKYLEKINSGKPSRQKEGKQK